MNSAAPDSDPLAPNLLRLQRCLNAVVRFGAVLTGHAWNHAERESGTNVTAAPGAQPGGNAVVGAPGSADSLRAGLKDWIDIGTKTAFVALTACYVMGLLVVNFYLSRYGLAQFGLLHVEYVTAGVVWLFLVLLGTFAAKGARHTVAYQIAGWKAGGRRFWPAVGALVTILIAPWFLFFAALMFLTEGALRMYHWESYLVCIGLALQGRFAMDAWMYVGKAVNKVRDGSLFARQDDGTVYRALYEVAGFLTLVPLYAFVLYPLLSPTFGGARESDISMVVKAEQVPVIRALGFSIDGERMTVPVKLIFETPEFLLLRPPSQKNGKRELKAIRIRRDLVDAVLYVEPKR